MDKKSEQLQQLTEIRSMMERSSRFISLSGLSGISAGIIALIGVSISFMYLGAKPFGAGYLELLNDYNYSHWGVSLISYFTIVSIAIFSLAALIGLYFTWKRAKKTGNLIWGSTSKRVLLNGLTPLVAGGFLCIALITRMNFDLVFPVSLLFYGLACVNASKYTLNDILYLGIFEIVLGTVGLFATAYALEIWALGFGVLHIAYGIVMYKKYESS